MDLFEKQFGLISDYFLKNKKQKISDYSAFFDDELTTLTLLVSAILPKQKILLKPAAKLLVTPSSEAIFFPEQLALFKDKKLNQLLYKHQALVAAVLIKERICFDKKLSKKWMHYLFIKVKEAEIVAQLKVIFPNYQTYFLELFSAIDLMLDSDSWIVNSAEQIKNSGYENDLALVEIIKKIAYPFSKDISLIPAELCYLSELLVTSTTLQGEALPLSENELSSYQDKKQVEGKNNDTIAYVDLDKEQENMIMHSFEKMETAEDYQGGRRVIDSDDDLTAHQNAISELKMDKITRSSKRTKSIFNSSLADLITNPEVRMDKARSDTFKFYSEWNYKKNILVKDYCRLYLHQNSGDSVQGQKVIERVLEENSKSINYWQNELAMIFNDTGWKNHFLEGEEVNIDQFVRYLSDQKNRINSDARFFMQKRRVRNCTSVLVLIDQSLSTDSWVQNKKILDVEKDSVAIILLLLSRLIPNLAVAGTWSETRNHCNFSYYKKFNDDHQKYFANFNDIVSKGYTRLGPAIRHATDLLVETGEKDHLLILLTDGKPTDHDRYEGQYGMEDIYHAILEAKQKKVKVKALAIEKSAKYYFPLIFGKNDYKVLSDVNYLPQKLFEIFKETILR